MCCDATRVFNDIFWQTSDILYYEVLDIPLPELQCLKTLKVAFHHATKDEVSSMMIVCCHDVWISMSLTWFTFLYQVVIHTIRLPKNSTVGDVINYIKTKVSFYYYICVHPF